MTGVNEESSLLVWKKKITLAVAKRMDWRKARVKAERPGGRGFRSPGRRWWLKPGQHVPNGSYQMSVPKWQLPNLSKLPFHL